MSFQNQPHPQISLPVVWTILFEMYHVGFSISGEQYLLQHREIKFIFLDTWPQGVRFDEWLSHSRCHTQQFDKLCTTLVQQYGTC